MVGVLLSGSGAAYLRVIFPSCFFICFSIAKLVKNRFFLQCRSEYTYPETDQSALSFSKCLFFRVYPWIQQISKNITTPKLESFENYKCYNPKIITKIAYYQNWDARFEPVLKGVVRYNLYRFNGSPGFEKFRDTTTWALDQMKSSAEPFHTVRGSDSEQLELKININLHI